MKTWNIPTHSASVDEAHPLKAELAFTETYCKYTSSPHQIREAHCTVTHLRHLVTAPEAEDCLLGRIVYPSIGISPEYPLYGYYCLNAEREGRTALQRAGINPAYQREARRLMAFWESRSTIKQIRRSMSAEMHQMFPHTGDHDWCDKNAVAFTLMRLAGMQLDHRQTVKLGLPGLLQQLRERLLEVEPDTEAYHTLSGALVALNGMSELFNEWADRIEASSENPSASCGAQKIIAENLRNLTHRPPQNFHEAVQLTYLFSTLAGCSNHGRMDVYLGDFLARDLERGTLDWGQARGITLCLWKLMNASKLVANHRIIVGGKGRPNSKNADLFVRLAMETQAACHDILPSLTLRLEKAQDPALFQYALDVISEGNTQPMFLNDEVNIPAVAQAFKITKAEAVDYLPFGCGEYVIWGKSIGTPNAVINLPKVLELVLRGGIDSYDDRQYSGFPFKSLAAYETFEALQADYCDLLDKFSEQLAAFQRLFYDVSSREISFPLISILTADCLAEAKGVLSGGVRYAGGTNETFGNITASDSLEAIRKTVFVDKTIAPDTLLAALSANFQGFEDVRTLLKQVPKFGNDAADADAMAVWAHEAACLSNRKCNEKVGLHHFLVVVINNSANVILGRTTGATADGRLACDALSNGNTPTAGNDTNGITALMNSIVKLDPSIHAGAVHNFKFSPETLKRSREQVTALFQTYFQRGGTQAMLTCVDTKDLKDAYEHPERHPNLMVRTGGFSARYVELPKDVQKHILERTQY